MLPFLNYNSIHPVAIGILLVDCGVAIGINHLDELPSGVVFIVGGIAPGINCNCGSSLVSGIGVTVKAAIKNPELHSENHRGVRATHHIACIVMRSPVPDDQPPTSRNQIILWSSLFSSILPIVTFFMVMSCPPVIIRLKKES